MNKFLFCTAILLLVSANYMNAQGLIERYVLSQGGGEGMSGTVSLNMTLGEAIIYKLDGPGSVTLSQGFQQGETVPTTSLSKQEEQAFTVYPNPVVDVLAIEKAKDTKELMVRIYDLAGKLVLSKHFPQKYDAMIRIHMNSLTAGMYILELSEAGELLLRERIIKRPR